MPAPALRLAALCAVLLMATSGAPAQQASADRIAAERVLRLGGGVILAGQQRPIYDLDQLPDTDFRLRTLDLVGVSMGAWGLKDELSRLPPLPHLKELYLNGRLWYNQPTSLVADTIGLFATSAELEKLVLSKPVQTYIPLEDPVLERFSTVSGLTALRLHQTKLPGAALAAFTKLKYLDLSHNSFFDDRGLRHIGRMTALEKLYLTGTSISDDGVGNLAALKELNELALDGTTISDAGLAHLAGLSKLKRLNLLSSRRLRCCADSRS
jgi:Leucine-rich repeat (LRR) protein